MPRAARVAVSMAVVQDRPDAAEMTKSWARNAKAPGARFRSLMITAARVTISVIRARRLEPGSEEARAQREQSAKRIVGQLLQLGPTFIKLGQVASCRPDILAAEYISALSVLQDDVPADDFETVRATLEAELGRPLAQLFGSFERTPLAAASLGQVHRATLLNGTQVVVKVQRPLLRELYEVDLAGIRRIAGACDLLGRLRPGGGAQANARKWRDFADEAGRLLLREIDYRQEAASQTEMGANLAGLAWVRVPLVVPELSGARVLTMEFLPGTKISSLDQLDATPGIDRRLLAQRLAHAFLLQFCTHGFFHTDPHPGNIGVDQGCPGGRLLLYDYGQCSRIQPFQRAGILSVIKAILASDPDACVRAFDELGIVSPRTSRAQLRAVVAKNFATGRIGRKGAQSASESPRALQPERDAGGAQGSEAEMLSLSSEYTFVFRVLAQMGGVGRALDPDFEFINAVAPLVAEREGVAFLLGAELEKLGWRQLRAFVRQPQAVEAISERLASWEAGSSPLQVRSAQLEQRLDRMEHQAQNQQRLLVALATLQLALLTSARVPQLLAIAAGVRWALGLVRSRTSGPSDQ